MSSPSARSSPSIRAFARAATASRAAFAPVNRVTSVGTSSERSSESSFRTTPRAASRSVGVSWAGRVLAASRNKLERTNGRMGHPPKSNRHKAARRSRGRLDAGRGRSRRSLARAKHMTRPARRSAAAGDRAIRWQGAGGVHRTEGKMADVNIQQTPSSGESRGGSGAVWAVVVIILLLVIGWFIFGGGFHRSSTTNLNVNVPGQSGGSGSGGSGGGTGGTGGGTGGGATKTP